ncbi:MULTISPECIES: hypothetical protein [Exiguobacterium]|uniref:hypothetical protein n=1 Tax=Exiguobacterium TaxID=33986 RepID=UPI00047EBE13|nr:MULTISPECIES: hypothetical protein [Exiguobacterium]MCT4781552.1 hypothetical protein [Exiguobacterium soli]
MELYCRVCTYHQSIEVGQKEEWKSFPSMLTYGIEHYTSALPFLFVPPYQEPLVSRQQIDDRMRADLIRAYHAHIDEIEEGWVPHQYDLFQCPSCHAISTRFWCALFLKKEIIEPMHQCERDGFVLTRLSLDDVAHTPCPNCCEQALHIR